MFVYLVVRKSNDNCKVLAAYATIKRAQQAIKLLEASGAQGEFIAFRQEIEE